jgi:DNA-binding NtrC family response regulator
MSMMIGLDKIVKILVVDDDPNMINLMKFYLIKENVEIVSSADGHEALRILAERTFDLILIDILMPRMDGHTLLKKMIAEKKINAPVIVVTAHGPTDNLMTLIDDGAYDILQKPFTTNRLKLTLYNALQHKSLIDQCAKMINSVNKDNASR